MMDKEKIKHKIEIVNKLMWNLEREINSLEEEELYKDSARLLDYLINSKQKINDIIDLIYDFRAKYAHNQGL